MSYAVNVANQQVIVDRYFESVAPKWNQLYRQQGLKAAVFAYRQSVAFRWLMWSLNLRDSDVLDVGCGAGPASMALAGKGARVKAIDTVPAMVELTRHNAEQMGLAALVDVSVGDVHALGFAERAFDAVVAIGVLYWLHSPETALREMLRVLKPGGLLVVSADNARRLTYTLDPGHLAPFLSARRLVGRWLRSFGWRKTSVSIPVNRYTLLEFDELVLGCGFEKLQGVTLGFGPFSIFEWKLVPDALGLRLQTCFQSLAERNHPVFSATGNHYLVLARKPAETSGA